MMATVVDTNVLIVANEASDHVTPDCILASINSLSALRQNGIIALDDSYIILEEYRRQASLASQPGVGHAFLRHVYDNLYNNTVCKLVPITPTSDGSFAEFPNDERLSRFHTDDRKFVAVALACVPAAEVVNATDTDWWVHRDALQDNGVCVRYLCPELMVR